MEPADLNFPADDDRRLTALLQSPPLADDGFSDRVLAALPQPPPRWRRATFITVGGAAGVVIAFWRTNPWSAIAAQWETAAPALTPLASPSAFGALLFTTVLTACVFFANRSRRRFP